MCYQYWGKTVFSMEEESSSSYHLLPYHCLDVAAVGKILLDRKHDLRVRLGILSGLEPTVFVPFLLLLLTLHDIGKFASLAFQMLRPDVVRLLRGEILSPKTSCRHDQLGFMLWRDEKFAGRIVSLLPTARRRRRTNSAYDYLLRSVTGHHGFPPRPVSGLLRDFFDLPNDIKAAADFVLTVKELFFPATPLPAIPERSAKQLSWWLAGLTVLADWLGSNTDFFPFESKVMPLATYWPLACKRAERAVTASGLLASSPAPLRSLNDLFQGKITVPTPLQKACFELPLEQAPQLFLLEDVTGAGKTEAAIILAHRLLATRNNEGLFLGLPTMATANAMYSRMARVYRRLYAEGSTPSLVLAHGSRHLSKEFRQAIIPHTNIHQPDSYRDGTDTASASCSAWLADNAKKSLLAEIGVGTIDQALLAILPAKHQSLRLIGLLGKILIVDEVHAYDAYVHKLLQALLCSHARTGGSAILLSATLPAGMRHELCAAYLEGLGYQFPGPEHDTAPYPLLTKVSAQEISSVPVATRESMRRRVSVNLLSNISEVEELIANALKRRQTVCWIRNTVADARDAYLLLRGRFSKTALFHARFALADRLAQEESVLRCFGPDSSPEERSGRLLIATQVVEQSLDLDFDVLISDLAPIDLLIQRAGRLCRHNRDASGRRIPGPDQRGTAVFHLHGPVPSSDPSPDWYSAFFPRAKTVYPHHGQLWLTMRLLDEKGGFSMPDDARNMIESVYGDAALYDIPESLLNASITAEGEARAAAGLAELNALDLNEGYATDTANRWWDESVTPTRLGEPQVTVYLARWTGSVLEAWAAGQPFAWAMSAVQVRRSLAHDVIIPPGIPEDVLVACRENLPAKGKFGLLLPLIRKDDGFWQGLLLNNRGKTEMVFYLDDVGLVTGAEYHNPRETLS